jgi:hypothetical protein
MLAWPDPKGPKDPQKYSMLAWPQRKTLAYNFDKSHTIEYVLNIFR